MKMLIIFILVLLVSCASHKALPEDISCLKKINNPYLFKIQSDKWNYVKQCACQNSSLECFDFCYNNTGMYPRCDKYLREQLCYIDILICKMDGETHPILPALNKEETSQ